MTGGLQTFFRKLNCASCKSKKSTEKNEKAEQNHVSSHSTQLHIDISGQDKKNTPEQTAQNSNNIISGLQKNISTPQNDVMENLPKPTKRLSYSRLSESRKSLRGNRRRVNEITENGDDVYGPRFNKLPPTVVPAAHHPSENQSGASNKRTQPSQRNMENSNYVRVFPENGGDASTRSVADKLTQIESIHEDRKRYKPIIVDAQMYQHYNEVTERKERERLRDRLRDSLRRNLKRKRSDTSGVHSDHLRVSQISNFDEEIDGDAHKYTNSSFTVLRDSARTHSGVTATAKDGAMRSVAQELAGSGVGRARWVEMPDVVRLDLATGLSSSQRNLMEARFEILTSEASYYKSLTVLIDLFYKSPNFQPNFPNAVVTAMDKHQLFSNILDIHVTSENLLHSLEMNFREDPTMEGFCQILYDHSENKLSCYITYLKNQMYQLNTLSNLLKKPAFVQAVKNIQSVAICNGLDLNSFLILPMQRVMRLRLLVDSVIRYTPKEAPVYKSGLIALASLEKLIGECNAQKGHMERKERLIMLTHNLEFNSSTPTVGMADRELVKEGNLRILPNSIDSMPGHKLLVSDVVKIKPIPSTLFLFTDILLITKPKGERYSVEEICSRDKLTVTVKFTSNDAIIKRSKLQTKLNSDDPFYVVPKISLPREITQTRSQETTPTGITVNRDHSLTRSFRGKEQNSFRSSSSTHENGESQKTSSNIFTFILTFPSLEGGLVDYHFMAENLEVRERWIDALSPGYYSVPPEVSYDAWDCPQMIVISGYGAKESDELQVKEGDLINVIVELSDGWLKGILPDGRSGWLPKQNCAEVENAQERRQNMKNFLLAEEAQRAYAAQKISESNQRFASSDN